MKHIRLKIVLLSIGAVLLIFGGLMVYGVMDYTRKAPKITSRSVTVHAGDTVPVAALADYESVSEKKIVDAQWSDGSRDDITIAQDRQSLTVGEQTGSLRVTVTACGLVAEYRDAEITVTVEAAS